MSLKTMISLLYLTATILLFGCSPQYDPDDQVTLMTRVAQVAKDTGNVESSINILRRANRLDPNELEPILMLADTLSEIGNHHQAAIYYQKVLYLDKTNVHALRGLTRTYIAMNKPAEGLTEIKLLLKDNPKDFMALNSLGVLLDLNREHTLAQQCYATGLKSSPDDIGLNNNYGLSLVLTQQYQEGISYLNRASIETPTGERTDENHAHIKNLVNAINEKPTQREKDLLYKQLLQSISPNKNYSQAEKVNIKKTANEFCKTKNSST